MNKRKKILSLVLSCVLVLCTFLSPEICFPAGAVSQEEIDALQAQRDALAQQAQEQQQIIDQLTASKARYIQRKIALDTKIELNKQEILLINSQLEIYDQMVAEKEAELNEARAAELAQSELLRSRMRTMEESGELSFLTFIFEARSLTDMLSRIADISDIMHYDKTLEDQYIAAREDVAAIYASYEETRMQQENLVKELESRREQLAAQEDAACQLIASIDDLADGAQAEYDAIYEAQAEADAEIRALIAKREAEQAAARRPISTGGGSGGEGENSGGWGGSAASLTSLMWPVPSCNLITSTFGYRTSPTAGASSNHGGLDIGAQMGATIVASQAGEVIMSQMYGGYGNCVMIDHGDGVVTLYAHMDSTAVSYGSYVSQGQVIGYVGSTGVSTGPHCHYEIRINGAQTDPAAYFSGLQYYL